MSTPDSAVDHAPDYPFGCNASWDGPRVEAFGGGGLHICNLSNTHHGQPHECKCGATNAEPKPVPGPPPMPRCRACGGPFSVGGAIRYHQSDCPIGQEMDRQRRVDVDVQDAISKALTERRSDREFMDRLHARIKADGVLLEKLADA